MEGPTTAVGVFHFALRGLTTFSDQEELVAFVDPCTVSFVRLKLYLSRISIRCRHTCGIVVRTIPAQLVEASIQVVHRQLSTSQVPYTAADAELHQSRAVLDSEVQKSHDLKAFWWRYGFTSMSIRTSFFQEMLRYAVIAALHNDLGLIFDAVRKRTGAFFLLEQVRKERRVKSCIKPLYRLLQSSIFFHGLQSM